MTASRFVTLCMVCALSAFIGGAASEHIFTPLHVGAQSKPEIIPVIRTGRLELTDREGRLRGVLSVADDSGAGLVLFTDAGEKMVSIGADEAAGVNPSIDFFDGTGKTSSLLMGIYKDGSPVVRLDDAKGQPRLALLLSGTKRDPTVVLKGTEGVSSILGIRDNSSTLVLGMGGPSLTSITSLNTGGAMVSMGNAAKKDGLILNLEAKGGSSIQADSFQHHQG